MSSHREAPEISKDPVADGTDVYAFVSPNRPEHVTLIANFIPLQKPDGGPNFYEFGDDVLYEIHVNNRGDATRDVSFQFKFTHQGPQRQDVPLQHRADHHDRRARTGTVRSSTRSPGSTGRATRRTRRSCSARVCACPPVNVGPRSTPNYAKLSAQAVHDVKQGIKVFCRPAGRRVPRRPRQHLRPRRAAAVQRGPPDLDAEHERRQLGAVLQRAHHRARGPDQAADPRRQRAEEPAQQEGGHRRVGDGEPAQVADVRQGQGQVHRPRSLGAGLPPGQPAVQRGHRADGREGRVERPPAVERQALREVREQARAGRGCCPCSTRGRSRTSRSTTSRAPTSTPCC